MAGENNSGNSAEERELRRGALIDIWLSQCVFSYHRFAGTNYLIAICISPDTEVIGSGYAQRAVGEDFIMEVAVAYAKQEAELSARNNLNSISYETLLERFNNL